MTTRSSVFFSTGRISKTIAYYVSFIGLGMVAAVLGSTLPELAEQTNTDKGDIGLLIAARSLAYTIGSLAAGRLYDRYPGHYVIIGAVLILTGMFLFVPAISLLWLMIFIFFVMGIGEAGLDVGGNTMLLWTHGEKVGPFMNGLHFFFGVGAFLAPIVVAQSLDLTDGIAWAYVVIGLSLLPLILIFARLPAPEIHTVAKHAGSTKGEANLLLVGLAVLFLFLYVGVELGFGHWIYTYAYEGGFLSEIDSAYLNSAFWGTFTLGRLLGIPVAIRFRPRTILLGSLLGAFASLALMITLQETVFLWIGTLTMGFSIAPVFPTTLSFVERRTVMTGQITSLFFVGAGAGAMVIPWSIGALMEAQGNTIMLWLVAATALLMLAVYGVIMMLFSSPTRVEQDTPVEFTQTEIPVQEHL